MTTPLGNVSLTVGSLYKWQLTLTKDGATWDLSAQTVTLWWKRPAGTTFSKAADTVTSAGVATYSDVASQLDVAGAWTLAAFVTGFGWTLPVAFTVVVAP